MNNTDLIARLREYETTGGSRFNEMMKSAADALEAAQPVGEPVAQLNPGNFRQEPDGKEWCRQVLLYSPNNESDKFRGVNTRVKLYAHPAQPAPQVPMTDKEIAGAWIRIADPIALGGALPRENAVRDFVRAIEAHHKIGVKP